jgi:hypothetical protein
VTAPDPNPQTRRRVSWAAATQGGDASFFKKKKRWRCLEGANTHHKRIKVSLDDAYKRPDRSSEG